MLLMGKNIARTNNTPEVVLNSDGMFKIRGRSMNANVPEFSKQIEDWIDLYICNPADVTCVDIYLEYLNTTNFRFYISLLNKINSIKLKDKKYLVNWYYEEGDEDIIEKGEYISSILEVPFNFIMMPDPELCVNSANPALAPQVTYDPRINPDKSGLL